MTENVVWEQQKITRREHRSLKGHRSFCLWFTGLSGAGKSTLATAVQARLHTQAVHTYLLDGDNVRHGLNGDLGFSSTDRQENVRRIAQVANLFVDAGIVAITALISPFLADRRKAREIFPGDSFIEIFVQCPLGICAERDPKGFYMKAKAGIIKDFTGISSPYEPPANPEIMVDTSEMSIEDCTNQIVSYLQQQGYIQPLEIEVLSKH